MKVILKRKNKWPVRDFFCSIYISKTILLCIMGPSIESLNHLNTYFSLLWDDWFYINMRNPTIKFMLYKKKKKWKDIERIHVFYRSRHTSIKISLSHEHQILNVEKALLNKVKNIFFKIKTLLHFWIIEKRILWGKNFGCMKKDSVNPHKQRRPSHHFCFIFANDINPQCMFDA